MKKLILASVSAVALMAAASNVSAQVATQTLNQSGNGNSATIGQTVAAGGANVNSIISQNGGNNAAEVTQTGTAGPGADSNVTIRQFSLSDAQDPAGGNSTKGNLAKATQSGGVNNNITIRQGSADEAKNGNSAEASQEGSNNTATITQN